MKTIFLLWMVILFTTWGSFGQVRGSHTYPQKTKSDSIIRYNFNRENLAGLGQEELRLYYDQALRMKHTGNWILVGGIGVFASMFLIGSLEVAEVFVPLSIGLVISGIAISAVNSSRLKRVKRLKSTQKQMASLQLQPALGYSELIGGYHTGVTLVLRF